MNRVSFQERRRKRPWTKVLCCGLLLCPQVDAVPSVPTYRIPDEPQAPHEYATEQQQQQHAPVVAAAARSTPLVRSEKALSPVPDIPSVPSIPTVVNREPYQDFISWCTNVMGIQSKLEIGTFEYYDYQSAHAHNLFDLEDDFCDDDDDFVAVEDLPKISVRGLAAQQDIEIGEVVVSVPLHAMISVPTTIDHDPVLSRLLGPKARKKFGWDDPFFEAGLLTVALLHHFTLGKVSPLAHYMDILETTPTDAIPFTWSKDRLRREMTEGVRQIARGIHRDVKDMYVNLMEILLAEHPTVFLPEAYSFEKFRWAFALVNSRHWHVPIPDLEPPMKKKRQKQQHPTPSPAVGDLDVPPADQPTEDWVREQTDTKDEEAPQKDEEEEEEEEELRSHSFLAPVADLLNFGPPCTRGKYNAETQAFELIATCSYTKGQEVTYWYSNDCDDVMIANYGFTHPMVPSCVSDWKQQTEYWKQQAERLEVEIGNAYQDLDALDKELDRMHMHLQNCDCDDHHGDGPRIRQKARGSGDDVAHDNQHVRGGNHHRQHDGVRSKWTHKKSDLGL